MKMDRLIVAEFDWKIMESCTYIGSQNPPHIVLLLWPKIDRVLGELKFVEQNVEP